MRLAVCMVLLAFVAGVLAGHLATNHWRPAPPPPPLLSAVVLDGFCKLVFAASYTWLYVDWLALRFPRAGWAPMRRRNAVVLRAVRVVERANAAVGGATRLLVGSLLECYDGREELDRLHRAAARAGI